MNVSKKNVQLAVDLRHELHTHPELSNEEVWTKKRLLDFLREHTTNLEVVDQGTWFYAAYRTPNATENIGFRADFDALPMDEYISLPWASKIPGKAHKCGHDGHSASLMAFALEVDQKGAANNVFFLWQPAEEVGEGARQCVPMIEKEKITRMYGYHNMHGYPLRAIAIRDDVIMCASTGMIIKVTGKPAHASQPETGKNPALVISQLVQVIPELTKQSRDLLLCTVVQVNVGNRQFGMSAHYGELLVTIRAVHEEELEQLRRRLAALAEERATAGGFTVAFEYSDGFPETRNEASCVARVRETARLKGLEVCEVKEPLRPSEDFGHYGKKCKAAFFFIGNGVDYPPIHTASYDFRDEILEVAVEMFKGLAGEVAPQRLSSL